MYLEGLGLISIVRMYKALYIYLALTRQIKELMS